MTQEVSLGYWLLENCCCGFNSFKSFYELWLRFPGSRDFFLIAIISSSSFSFCLLPLMFWWIINSVFLLSVILSLYTCYWLMREHWHWTMLFHLSVFKNYLCFYSLKMLTNSWNMLFTWYRGHDDKKEYLVKWKELPWICHH